MRVHCPLPMARPERKQASSKTLASSLLPAPLLVTQSLSGFVMSYLFSLFCFFVQDKKRCFLCVRCSSSRGGRARREASDFPHIDRDGVRRQGTAVHRETMISSAQKDTPPPPPPPPRTPKRRRRNGFPLPCVCVLGIIMACVGDLWDADTYVVVVDGRFSHESRPAGLCRLRVGLGLFFVDCPFFPLSRSGRHESMETGRTRERGDSSFNCCPVLSLLLVVRFRSETPGPSVAVEGSREGARGRYVPYPMLPFPFLHFPFFHFLFPFVFHSCLAWQTAAAAIHCLVRRPGFPLGWIRTVFPRMMESFRCSRLFPLLGFWAILNLESSVPASVSTPPIPHSNQLASSRWHGDAQQLPSWHRRSVRGTKQ